MGAAARAQPAACSPVYSRRQPEKTALYQVLQHLLTFEQQWTDQASGRTLPKFVTEDLHKYLDCGILARGFAHLYCDDCGKHQVVAFSCKARAVCPSCLGRRMNEGALNLTDHVLPDVPLRQFVLTMPFPLRFPLAFDGKLLGQVLRIFTDTVAGWYRRRHADRGLPTGETGAVTAIQRANSDLRLSLHFHTVFLDGLYSPHGEGKGQMFHPAPTPTQQEIEALVCRASKRILRFLQRRGVITLVSAPGDGEVTVVSDESMGDKDPLLARLPAAATAGMPPAGPANKRKPVRIVLDCGDRPVAKGTLCAQEHGFNLHAATKVACSPTRSQAASGSGTSYGSCGNSWGREGRESNCFVLGSVNAAFPPASAAAVSPRPRQRERSPTTASAGEGYLACAAMALRWRCTTVASAMVVQEKCSSCWAWCGLVVGLVLGIAGLARAKPRHHLRRRVLRQDGKRRKHEARRRSLPARPEDGFGGCAVEPAPAQDRRDPSLFAGARRRR